MVVVVEKVWLNSLLFIVNQCFQGSSIKIRLIGQAKQKELAVSVGGCAPKDSPELHSITFNVDFEDNRRDSFLLLDVSKEKTWYFIALLSNSSSSAEWVSSSIKYIYPKKIRIHTFYQCCSNHGLMMAQQKYIKSGTPSYLHALKHLNLKDGNSAIVTVQYIIKELDNIY